MDQRGQQLFYIRPYTEDSFKLNDHNSIFQAGVAGLTQGANRMSALISKSINFLGGMKR